MSPKRSTMSLRACGLESVTPEAQGLTIIRHSDLACSQWANGAGVTRQVAVEPEDSGIDSFDWRISIAEVVSECSFSSLPGIDRWILLVDGPSMALTIDGVECSLDSRSAVRFRGEAVVTCSVPGGPTRDLNVMCRRGEFSASLTVLHAQVPVRVSPADEATTFLTSFSGAWLLPDLLTPAFEPGDFLRLGEPLTVQSAGTIVLICIRRTRAMTVRRAFEPPRP